MKESQSQTELGESAWDVFGSASEWPRMFVRSTGIEKLSHSQRTSAAEALYSVSVGGVLGFERATCSMPMLSELAPWAWKATSLCFTICTTSPSRPTT